MKKQGFPEIYLFFKRLPYPILFDYNIIDSKQEDMSFGKAAPLSYYKCHIRSCSAETDCLMD